MILLDTHCLIWLADGNPRLGRRARALLEADDDRRISAIAMWELAMLVDAGRIALAPSLDLWIESVAALADLAEVAVTGPIAMEAGRLPGGIHGDPCDRIMVATARTLGCPLLTADEKILAYAAGGHVQAVDARV